MLRRGRTGDPQGRPALRLAEVARAGGRTSFLPVVLAAGAAFGLLLAVAVAPAVSLPYEPSGIVGWLSRHEHAKGTDYARFALLIGLPLAGAFAAWGMWVALARGSGDPGGSREEPADPARALRLAAIPFLFAPALWTLVPPGTTARGPWSVLAVGLGTLAAAALGCLAAERWIAARGEGGAIARAPLLAAFAAGAAAAVAWRIRFGTPSPFLAWLLASGAGGVLLERGLARLRPGERAARWRTGIWSVLCGVPLLSLLPIPTPVAVAAPVLACAGLAALARGGRLLPSARAAEALSLAAACAVLYALLADLLLGTIWSGAVDLYHEGESLVPAAAYGRGAIPYRDAAPLHGYFANGGFTRIAFAWLGETVEARRIAEWALHPLGAASALALAFAALRSRIVAAAGILLVLTFPLRPELRHAFGLLSCALLLGGIGSGKGLPFLAAGAAASLAFLVSLDVGVYALGGGGLFLLAYGLLPGDAERRREGRRGAVAFAAGAGSVAIAWGIWLASRGALGAFVEHTFQRVPRSQTAIWGGPMPDLFGVWRGVPVLGGFFPEAEAQAYETLGGAAASRFARDFLALPAALVAGLVFLLGQRIAGRWGPREWKGLALAIPALLALRSALGQPDRVHFAFALPWAWVLLLRAVEGAVFASRAAPDAEDRDAEGRAILAAALLLAMGGFVRTCDPWSYWRGAFDAAGRPPASGSAPRWLAWRPPADPVPSLPRLGRVRIPSEQEASLLELKGFLDAAATPGEPVFDFANAGALLFLLERPNPTRFAQAIYASAPDLQAEVVRALEAGGVRWAIVRGGRMDVVSGLSNAERLPGVWAYLLERFEPAGSPGGFEVWRRR